MSKEEFELRQEVRDAEEASRLLNHPMLQAAFAAVEQACKTEWLKAGANAEDGVRCWLAHQQLLKVRAQIMRHIDTGRIAEQELTLLEKARKKLGF